MHLLQKSKPNKGRILVHPNSRASLDPETDITCDRTYPMPLGEDYTAKYGDINVRNSHYCLN